MKVLEENAQTEQKDRTGIVYMSRVPPTMSPHELRALLSPFGQIGRIYLTPQDKDSQDPLGGDGRRKRKKLHQPAAMTEAGKHRRSRFVDGWVEFKSKRDAKTAVLALNGRPMGGRKLGRFHDDIWTLRYLGGDFKWNHLTEQISYENAIREQKMATELAQAKRETSAYLRQVEKARVIGKIVEKKKQKDGLVDSSPNDSSDPLRQTMKAIKSKFRQRKPINITTD